MIKSSKLSFGELVKFKDIKINKTDFLSKLYQDIKIDNEKLYDYYSIDYVNLLKDYYGERYFLSNNPLEAFRRVNNNAFLKLIAKMRDLELLESLYSDERYLQDGKETRTSTLDAQDTRTTSQDILTSGVSDNKYADTPSSVSGDLVDVFTTSQNRVENTNETSQEISDINDKSQNTNETIVREGKLLTNLLTLMNENDKLMNIVDNYINSFEILFLKIDPFYEDIYEEE